MSLKFEMNRNYEQFWLISSIRKLGQEIGRMIFQLIALAHVLLSIRTLVEEINPVVTENFEFDFRDELILKALFGIWDYQDFDAKIKKMDLYSNLPLEVEIFRSRP